MRTIFQSTRFRSSDPMDKCRCETPMVFWYVLFGHHLWMAWPFFSACQLFQAEFVHGTKGLLHLSFVSHKGRLFRIHIRGIRQEPHHHLWFRPPHGHGQGLAHGGGQHHSSIAPRDRGASGAVLIELAAQELRHRQGHR